MRRVMMWWNHQPANRAGGVSVSGRGDSWAGELTPTDPTLTYGPRSLDIHAFDERVHIESVRNITKTIALFIAEWCGLEPLK